MASSRASSRFRVPHPGNWINLNSFVPIRHLVAVKLQTPSSSLPGAKLRVFKGLLLTAGRLLEVAQLGIRGSQRTLATCVPRFQFEGFSCRLHRTLAVPEFRIEAGSPDPCPAAEGLGGIGIPPDGFVKIRYGLVEFLFAVPYISSFEISARTFRIEPDCLIGIRKGLVEFLIQWPNTNKRGV